MSDTKHPFEQPTECLGVYQLPLMTWGVLSVIQGLPEIRASAVTETLFGSMISHPIFCLHGLHLGRSQSQVL